MPTYPYRCSSCSHELEAFQKMSDEPLKTCPKCHTDSLKRTFAGGNNTFLFRGSGFYVTDYCKNSSSCKNCPNKPKQK